MRRVSMNNMSANQQGDILRQSAPQVYNGQRWLVEERDACGVGFIADLQARSSHDLVEKALGALSCLEHRGGCSADRDSGDGAGVLTALPRKILDAWLQEQGKPVPSKDELGVAMVFLPQDESLAELTRTASNEVLSDAGITVLGWRSVPVHPEFLGVQAKENQPVIEQILVQAPQRDGVVLTGDAFEQELFLVRRQIHKAVDQRLGMAEEIPEELEDFYICSFSSRTIVYKGMVRSEILGEFYADLTHIDYESPFAFYHRRFSTNTMPRWPLAQPMRMLGHNGEINTLVGNINWMMAREADLEHPTWSDRLDILKPTVRAENSDSANLDNVLELLVHSGRSPLESIMMMVPESYRNRPELDNYPEIIDFYEYYGGIQEPWDGPALLVFSDGKTVGASLDRNGLRPARYVITNDGCVIVASEAGVIPVVEEDVLEKGRLGPGQAIAVDLENHEILRNWDIKQRIAKKQPYGQWLAENRQELEAGAYLSEPQMDSDAVLRQQSAFGFTTEDVEMIIESMAAQGKEPTFCMGDDIPLAILSEKPRLLYDYFKQRFAQITNPAIDPLRESLVMSLAMRLGARGNLLDEKPEYARQIKISSPLFSESELEQLKQSALGTTTLSTLYPVVNGPSGLKQAVDELCQKADAAVKQGTEILILSDRLLPDGSESSVSEEYTYLPPLFVVGAVHHHLIQQGLRMKVSLVIDTAQCWSTHHFACLVGFGASAICPYLTWETVRQWWASSKTQGMMSKGRMESLTIEEAQANYRKSIEAGLLKILSKMGISLLSSYNGAQIFEAIGIGMDLLETAFRGTTSRVGGLSLADLAQENIAIHQRAFPELNTKKLQNFGFIQYRPGGEYHMNSPEMSKALHKAVADKNPDHYELYQQHLAGRPPTALRDLLDLEGDRSSIPVDEVESVEAIVKRFCTGGMSLGALSREAHETLAVAMNRIGGKSNSGEGGEDPTRYKVLSDVNGDGKSQLMSHLHGLRNGDTASSAIKQIASGRFGVTPAYLMSGQQLEIKVAQGAKPGEGGQLPGKKVSPYIAMLRRSKPGVPLISPPPHHDIYSIEDLAQLIFDLHQINPEAKVSVKLVAEIGIGTIAAGVAKANADVIQISGHDGGTGASPLSSIKHAGTPWELGVTEVHRVLLQNKLRDRVILRADGGLKTGWDVLMAALMGAEEYGFGSIAMIAEGCIMARICHTNNCPVGVATQQEKLRKRFSGTPEHVVNFFYFIAEEVRSLLARMGYRSLNEIIGRSDLLKPRENVNLTKTDSLNLDCLTDLPDVRKDRSWLNHEPVHSNGVVLDDELLNDADVQQAIANQGSITKNLKLVNTDRTVGTRIAGAIAKQYGDTGFEGQITLNLTGSAGQSFGAFILPGMTLRLEGEANDYVGKGMHGGEIIIKPPAASTFDPAKNVIVGNTCLYGSTGGILFANGQAGERFAVRNSKGQAIIEGTGDHCCEYMTGGVVVVLGRAGRNIGAGMTGGLAYFFDEEDGIPDKVNPEIVTLQRVSTEAGEQQLKGLIEAHLDRTGSAKAKAILDDWSDYLPKFWQVVPPSEADTPEASNQGSVEERVLTPAQ